jgi:hypothetical protein
MEMKGIFTWPRKYNTSADHRLIPDCSYNITRKVDSSKDFETFRFLITQSNCGFPTVPGGSSFHISGNSAHAVSFCSVTDHFDNTYEVSCPNVECEARRLIALESAASAKQIASEPPSTCLNLTVILDYEHFDAFSETKSNDSPMRHLLFDNYPACLQVDAARNSSITCEHREHFWLHNFGNHDLSDYEWESNITFDGSFPHVNTIIDCLSKQKVTFLIDGQLHMFSKYFEELYIEGFPQGGFKFDNTVRNFVLDAVDYFGTNIVPSCGNGKAITYVFEFGNWDLRHTPPRNLMTNPLTLPSMLDKIRSILQDSKCSNIRLIWVNTPPVHKCLHARSTCVHEIDSSWENIYAVNSINQFFHKSLLNISTSYPSRIAIIDRYEMLYPRMLSETYACGNMFVCDVKDKTYLETTSSFRAVAAEILRSACDIPGVQWQPAYSHIDKFFRTEKQNDTFYFYAAKGIRRRIPDEETARCLHRQTGAENDDPSLFPFISDQDLLAMPLDPSINAYPSRESGSVIQSNGDIFVMDAGKRRPINKTVIESHSPFIWGLLGRDHVNVKRISVNDMNIIPMGPVIVSEEETARITRYNDSEIKEEREKNAEMKRRAKKTYETLIPCLYNGTALTPKVPVSFPDDVEGHYYDLLERTAVFRNQPYHFYGGYEGPWIENHFIDKFIDKPLSYFNGLVPLFVQWVDVMVAGGDWDKIVRLMREILRPDVLYFTVCQSDEGLKEVAFQHPNILTISAGGFGHIPIPLVKGEDAFENVPETFQFSVIFCGNVKQHSRPEALENFKKSLIRHNQPYKISTYSPNWPQDLRATKFPLAPRGYGRSSFRYTEIIHSGRCPIYIYDDYPWIPYQGTNASIEKYGFYVKNSDSVGVDSLVAKIANMSKTEYRMMAANVAAVRHWFTYKGVVEQIRLFIEDPLGPKGGFLSCVKIPNSTKRRRR